MKQVHEVKATHGVPQRSCTELGLCNLQPDCEHQCLQRGDLLGLLGSAQFPFAPGVIGYQRPRRWPRLRRKLKRLMQWLLVPLMLLGLFAAAGMVGGVSGLLLGWLQKWLG